MNEICTDGRFELIEAYKRKLIERTNIETNPEEMAVIDNVLFRFWQMKWLPPLPHGRLIDADALIVDLMDRGVEGLQTDDWHEIQQSVVDAPTVIEAEGEE